MASSKIDPILGIFKRKIETHLGESLRQVILFGSKARGDDQVDSDYDCLVIVDEVTPELKETIDEIAGDLLFQYNAVFSIIPISVTNHLATQKYNPFLINITKEGISL